MKTVGGNRWRNLVGAAAVLALSGSCVERTESPNEESRGATASSLETSTLIAASTSDIAGINELVSSNDRFTQDVVDAQFLHLLQEQPDFESGPPTMEPQLARRYEWSEDRRSITFYLDPDAVWSDGEPITAEDVRWTWQAQVAPELAWAYAESKSSISDVEVVDRHTARFHLKGSYLAQLADLNLGVVLPRHRWSALPFSEWRTRPEWFLEHLVVSGPFRLERWERDAEVVLERNPRYAGPPARLERIVFRIIPDKSNQVAQLVSGDLTMIERVPPSEAARLAASPDVELIRYWPRQYDFLCWNTKRPLFADPAVRRALTSAIDRQALVETLWHGNARVSKSPIIASVWAHHADLEDHAYAPEEARRQLAAAGWVDRDGDGVLDRHGAPFRFEILTNNDSRTRTDAAAMIQEQLGRIGIDVRIVTLDFITVSDLTLAHDFDATISGWLIDTSLDVSYAFHSDEIDGGYNLGSYSNPRVDQLLDELGGLTEREALHARLVELQEILHEEQPYTFLWEPMRLNAARRRLRGAQSNALTSYFDLASWWIDGSPSAGKKAGEEAREEASAAAGGEP